MRIVAPGYRRSLLLLTLLVLPPGCSGTPEVPVDAAAPTGLQAIALKAKNYSFTPEYIRASAGGELLLEVENLSGSDHNITVETPEGRTLLSVDLPGGETTTVKARLKSAGIYPFTCDQPLHATMGMKGTILAE
jgi:plastocyanin